MLYLKHLFFFNLLNKMLKWQWIIAGKWIDCSEKNNQIFSARFEEPSMEPLYLTNLYGELWGCPEKKNMKFRVHGEEETVPSSVRQYCDTDPVIYAVYNGVHRTLIPPPTMLFEERAEEVRPRVQHTEVSIGTELFVAKEEKIYQKLLGKLEECSWKATNISVPQYNEMTKSRFVWEFKGPFRSERMRQTVSNVCRCLAPTLCRKLRRLFTLFCPDDEDATEYGPYQFPDFLCAHGEEGLACQVRDSFHSVSLQDWQPFDGITNAMIERRRRAGHSAVIIRAHGQEYMLLFDSGGGASGQPPAIVRPARYNKILTSIEDQFRRSALHELFDMLTACDVNPVSFLSSTNPEEILSQINDREAVMAVFHKVTHSSQYIATRIQRFMPALLDKYKECEIRLSQVENLSPKKLCKFVTQTLDNGLIVPDLHSFHFHCHGLTQLIEFIQQTQSWMVDKNPNGDCHICMTSNCVVLNHCGSATACLKCWVDTLTETNMKCPFCRQPVEGGQLTRSATQPFSPVQRHCPVSRRRFASVDDVLEIIHQDKQYSDITLESVNTMRKWFTILVRQHIVDISEMPTLAQHTEKKLINALTEFKVLR